MELDLSRSKLRALMRLPAFRSVGRIATELGRSSRTSGRLFVVGTPTYEPWHIVAHWQGWQARSGAPTLVRHHVPRDAPAHLSVGLDAITQATRADALLVIAPDRVSEDLLERLSRARHQGSTIFALAQEQQGSTQGELDNLVHDGAAVHHTRFEFAQHLLPEAAQTF